MLNVAFFFLSLLYWRCADYSTRSYVHHEKFTVLAFLHATGTSAIGLLYVGGLLPVPVLLLIRSWSLAYLAFEVLMTADPDRLPRGFATRQMFVLHHVVTMSWLMGFFIANPAPFVACFFVSEWPICAFHMDVMNGLQVQLHVIVLFVFTRLIGFPYIFFAYLYPEMDFQHLVAYVFSLVLLVIYAMNVIMLASHVQSFLGRRLN